MEEKINIAEILKDKPQGTKLYSILSDGECFLNEASEDSIYIDIDNGKRFWCLTVYGSTCSFPNGCVLLFPSREMRDWSKFAWKKGDVLQHSEYPLTVIFESFEDDTYTSFKCKYCFDFESASKWLVSNSQCSTKHFYKVSEEEAKEFIRKVELNYNGKLNRETLEIEKAQPEFKDGDIVFMKGIKSKLFANCIFILSSEYKDGDERAFYYAFYNADDKYTLDEYGNTKVHYSLRLATDSEKQQLFDALAKEGKAWDAEKKMIVELKSLWTPKPFDNVLVRDSKSDKWRANLFGYIGKDGYYCCVYANWAYCIPYIGNESLLGTTKDVEG